MTAQTYPRDTGEMQYALGHSAIGMVLVARTAAGISAVLLGDDRDALCDELRMRFPRATLRQGDAALDTLTDEVVRFVDSPARGLHATLDMRGSAFQREVWRALREIPVGATSSYTDIAIRIGRPTAVRAVAQACAANPLAVIVPCHRVLRRDGQLSGYRWGIERKRALLARESVA